MDQLLTLNMFQLSDRTSEKLGVKWQEVQLYLLLSAYHRVMVIFLFLRLMARLQSPAVTDDRGRSRHEARKYLFHYSIDSSLR